MLRHLLCTAMAVTVAFPAFAQAPESCPAVIRYADTGVEGLEELQRSFGPFVEVMSDATGLEIQFFPVANRTAAVTAMQFEQVDVVMTGPSEYVAITQNIDGAQALVSIARPQYASIFIVPEDSPAQSLEDLRGKRISMKEVGSTTGHIFPSFMLIQAGLDIDRDVTILNLGGTLFEALINGDVDATATGIRDWEPFMARTGGGFRILAQSDQLPDDVILAAPHIAPDCAEFIRDAMVEAGDKLIGALLEPEGRGRDRYRGARLVPVNDASYDIIREAYRALGLSVE